MSDTVTRVLGLDVGNGKVKGCLIEWRGDWAGSQVHWDSLPLPLSSMRRQDFGAGLPMQIFQFLDALDLVYPEIDSVVVCCSHSFSYQPYSESVRHLAEILALFGEVPVTLVRADGVAVPIGEIANLSDDQLYAYVFTNFYGSALLGSRLIRNGLSLDLGTTTLDIIPIIDGQIDPAGLAGAADPADYLRFRYTQGRIHWLGLTTVPLCLLAERVPLGQDLYQVVPRNYRSDLIFGLEPADAGLMTRHAYGHHFPAPDVCRRQLAEFVGLDSHLLGLEQIRAVRDYLLDRLIDKVATEIRAVAERCFASAPIEIASFALGQDLVLEPALARAGLAGEVRTLALRREQGLWSASSAFAMALLALEAQLGQRLDLP